MGQRRKALDLIEEAKALDLSKDKARYLELLSEAEDADPAVKEIFLLRGLLFYREGKWKEAGDNLYRYIRMDYTLARDEKKAQNVYMCLLKCFQQTGNKEWATKFIRNYVGLFPCSPAAASMVEKAFKNFENKDLWYKNLQEAARLQAAGDFKSSVRYFDKAIELNPEFSWGYYLRGLSVMKLSAHQNAIQNFMIAISLEREYLFYYQLASAYKAMGKLKEAEQSSMEAYARNPFYVPAIVLLGEISLENGLIEKSSEYFARVLAADPEGPFSEWAKKLLNTYRVKAPVQEVQEVQERQEQPEQEEEDLKSRRRQLLKQAEEQAKKIVDRAEQVETRLLAAARQEAAKILDKAREESANEKEKLLKGFQESKKQLKEKARAMIDSARLQAKSLLEAARRKEKDILTEANSRKDIVIDEANEYARSILGEAEERSRSVIGKAEEQARSRMGEADGLVRTRMGEAEEQARSLMGEAEEQARSRMGEAEEQARSRLGEVDEQARLIVVKAEEQGRFRIGEAEEQARLTAGKAEEKARARIGEAEERSRSILSKAEEQARALLGKAEEKARALLGKAEERARLIIGKAEEQGRSILEKARETSALLDDERAQEEQQRIREEREQIDQKARDDREQLNQRAREESERLIQKARQEQEQIIQKARGEQEQMIQKAKEEREFILQKTQEEKDLILQKARVEREQMVQKTQEERDLITQKIQEERELMIHKTREEKEQMVQKTQEEKDLILQKAREEREQMIQKTQEERDLIIQKIQEERELMNQKAKEEREQIIQKAREEAESILSRARGDAEAILKEAAPSEAEPEEAEIEEFLDVIEELIESTEQEEEKAPDARGEALYAKITELEIIPDDFLVKSEEPPASLAAAPDDREEPPPVFASDEPEIDDLEMIPDVDMPVAEKVKGPSREEAPVKSQPGRDVDLSIDDILQQISHEIEDEISPHATDEEGGEARGKPGRRTELDEEPREESELEAQQEVELEEEQEIGQETEQEVDAKDFEVLSALIEPIHMTPIDKGPLIQRKGKLPRPGADDATQLLEDEITGQKDFDGLIAFLASDRVKKPEALSEAVAGEVDNLITQAEEFIKSKEWDKTIELLEEVLNKDSSNEDACEVLCTCYSIRGRIYDMVGQRCRLARILQDNGHREEAREVIEKTLRIDSEGSKSRIGRIILFRKEGDSDALVSACLEFAGFLSGHGFEDCEVELVLALRQLHPHDLYVGLRLGDIFRREGKKDEAIVQFRMSGEQFLQAGNKHKALESYRKLKEISPPDKSLYMLLGSLYQKTGDLDAAELEFRAALKLNLNDPEALSAFGSICVDKGSFRDGILAFSKVLQMNPNAVFAREQLGVIYTQLGTKELAIKNFMDAAGQYASEGNRDKAIAIYKKVLELNPDQKDAKAALDTI